MKSLSRPLAVVSIACGLALISTVPLAAAGTAYFQYDHDHDMFGDLRGLIQRTQTDLESAEHNAPNDHKQRDRYRNAQEHLSDFDRRLTHGHFDKGDLDHAIGSVRDILDHNTLLPSSRDALFRDMEDMRVARDRH